MAKRQRSRVTRTAGLVGTIMVCSVAHMLYSNLQLETFHHEMHDRTLAMYEVGTTRQLNDSGSTSSSQSQSQSQSDLARAIVSHSSHAHPKGSSHQHHNSPGSRPTIANTGEQEDSKTSTLTIRGSSDQLAAIVSHTSSANHNQNSSAIVVASEKEHRSSTTIDSMAATVTSVMANQHGSELKFLDCETIQKLQVLRRLTDEGEHKAVFQVLLPWGTKAVAKRCKTEVCFRDHLLQNETQHIRQLYNDLGDNADVAYYGECEAPMKQYGQAYIEERLWFFNRGYTAILGYNTTQLNSYHTLGCDEIGDLQPRRILAEGETHIAYEVKLPWGELAMAKRCKTETCFREKSLEKATQLVQETHEQWGSDAAIWHFGECNATMKSYEAEYIRERLHVFTRGYTAIASYPNRTGVQRPLGCQEIQTLKPIRLLAEGKRKVAFEVELPWGERAVAKRCRDERCVTEGLVQTEARLMKGLYKQYGSHAIHFYGECDAPMHMHHSTYIEARLFNFTRGYTSIVELGDPLVDSWEMNDYECFAEFYTSADIEDLIDVARRYATYAGGPLLMKLPKDNKRKEFTDNRFPQQYIALPRNQTRKLFHADLDMLDVCTDKFDAERCTVEWVLQANCEVIADLVNRPGLNCSLVPSTNNSTEAEAVADKITTTSVGDASFESPDDKTHSADEDCVEEFPGDCGFSKAFDSTSSTLRIDTQRAIWECIERKSKRIPGILTKVAKEKRIRKRKQNNNNVEREIDDHARDESNSNSDED